MDAQLQRLERDRQQARGALDEQLRTLAAGQDSPAHRDGCARLGAPPAADARALGRAAAETRRRAGGDDWRTATSSSNPSLSTDDGLLRPDLVVQLPGGKQVIVDAKAPLNAFLDAYEARDETTRTQQLAAHARLLREHVRRLSAKAYWDQFETAPDFVFLFLPGEHFYSAALEADPSLLEEGAAPERADRDADDADRAAAGGRVRLAAGARRTGRARGRAARRELHRRLETLLRSISSASGHACAAPSAPTTTPSARSSIACFRVRGGSPSMASCRPSASWRRWSASTRRCAG